MSTITARRSPMYGRHIPVLGIVLWLAAVVTGVMTLVVHSNEPGDSVVSLARWPDAPQVQLHPEKPTLIMFAHPRCPCSRASMRELARIVEPDSERVEVQVHFYCPGSQPADWAQTELWDLAGQMDSAQTQVDLDGRAAAVFGIKTSGHVLLFAPSGELLYSGGVTSSRAHEGESVCSQAIHSRLQGDTTRFVEFPVFGCPLIPASEADNE